MGDIAYEENRVAYSLSLYGNRDDVYDPFSRFFSKRFPAPIRQFRQNISDMCIIHRDKSVPAAENIEVEQKVKKIS
ncbi:hypothetical protein [Paenibacillus ihuae]|uniref:hypothetical protein n=1 Tax=Paenibacillus ihuae TaxID=1232431 RepID=UPI00131BEB92|nr:hypothetical protein [Paenibacillus ihuae]